MTVGDNLNPKEMSKQKNGFLQEISIYRTFTDFAVALPITQLNYLPPKERVAFLAKKKEIWLSKYLSY